MDDFGTRQQERVFLQEQLTESQHKIARLKNARSGCHDCPEANGLDALLRAASTQCRLIEDLLAHEQNAPPAEPLNALIVARIRRLEAGRDNPTLRWRRGCPTPPAYWEAANERTILEQLLRRWHAWKAGRPYYPQAVNGTANHAAPLNRPSTVAARANPWRAPAPVAGATQSNAHDDPEKLLQLTEARRAELLTALAHAGIAPDHVEIIFATDQLAFVTAYAHHKRERRAIINTIVGADYVDTLLADIRVTDRRWCPICRARKQREGGPTQHG